MHDPEGRSPKSIGHRLSLVRRALGMSQKDFCEHVSISAPTYNQIEKGINLPGLDKARALKDRYGLTLDFIYDGDPSSLPHSMAKAVAALQEQEAARREILTPTKPLPKSIRGKPQKAKT